MIEFQYDGITSDGKACQGTIRALNVETARLRLIGQGVTPVRIADESAAVAQDEPQSRGGKLKRGEILLFSREMAHLKQANMPLDKALVMLKETANTERLKAFIAKVEEGVRGGKSLYQSLLAFVVPQFREIFDSMGDKLPYSTRLVVDLSDLIRSHWMAILLGLTAVLFLGSRWGATPAGRLRVDSVLLDLPLFGKVLRNLQFAIYFRTFGILLQRGVPMVDALRIAVDTLTNTALRKDIEPLVGIVKTGKRLSTGFVSPYFGKSSTPQLIRVAEETGQLDITLLGLADRYEDEGRRTMGRVLAAMEPLIIIVLGALVAFIIIAILGGVLSINDTI